MQRILLAIAAVVLSASAGAGHVYHGIAEGDSDLYGYGPGDEQVSGVQPGVGSFDVYGGFGEGNSDLFPPQNRGGAAVDRPDRDLPRIYNEFGDTPDLSW
ncbi:MAG: hypothetical protein K9L70_08770 [Thiohalocapsa sp.]|jgi:hypothetical protein|nr:hypothetical protein [Thiohalocapsa sp.]MCF7989544.1 hypothetical protein [Thiohalocapsa sp.]